MTIFLTSHIGGSVKIDGQRVPSSLMTGNELVSNLQKRWPERARVLFIASDPENTVKTDFYCETILYAFPLHDMQIDTFTVCDCRNMDAAASLRDYDVIILSGGHVPTQNRFFGRIGLKERISSFKGILIGISAGTMNCAKVVYAQPEEEGEAVDPDYQRFFPGLGLTKRMVLPHYQAIKEDVLDGLRVFEDVAYPDSYGREFYALNDGSYILSENGVETLYGEAYLIRDGRLTRICRDGETLVL